jgi:hypothetical protein
MRENIKISAKEIICCYELNKHKQWFEERCSKLLVQTKKLNSVVTGFK